MLKCGLSKRVITARIGIRSGEDIQLPSAVTQLGTSLADVKMADLDRQIVSVKLQIINIMLEIDSSWFKK